MKNRFTNLSLAVCVILILLLVTVLSSCGDTPSPPASNAPNTQKPGSTPPFDPENLYAASLQELGDMWADAYSRRDAETMYRLCHESLFEALGGYTEEGVRYVDPSSAWASPLHEDDLVVTVRDGVIELIQYWHASYVPMLTPELVSLQYVLTENGYQATGLTALEITVPSKAMFDLYYGKGGYPGNTGWPDGSPPYDSAVIAAKALGIKNAQTDCREQNDGSIRLTFTWQDGSAGITAWWHEDALRFYPPDEDSYESPPAAPPSPETLAKFGITYDEPLLPDWTTFDDEKLMLYCLGADGAYAEGSFSELAARFIENPNRICQAMMSSDYIDAPALDVLCFYIAVDNVANGKTEELRTALDRMDTAFLDDVMAKINDALVWAMLNL